MYEEFYHLNQNPFQINTDPKFLWLGEKHKEALAVLRYGVLGNKSFLLLTGDVGTGKTTLINALMESLDQEILVSVIQDPDLPRLDLFNLIAHAFGMQERFTSKGMFLVRFKEFLVDISYRGQKALLIIDEAQRLNQPILEEIRLLSNIEKDGNKLLNIFFVGQNEFIRTLMREENKAIRQRITVSFNLSTLGWKEVSQYIAYRLAVAGARHRIFKPEAVAEIHAFSRGYPRLINILCDRCLITGFVKGKKVIGKAIVRECCAEVDLSRQLPVASVNRRTGQEPAGQAGPASPGAARGSRMRAVLLWGCVLALTVAAGLGIAAWQGRWRTRPGPVSPGTVEVVPAPARPAAEQANRSGQDQARKPAEQQRQKPSAAGPGAAVTVPVEEKAAPTPQAAAPVALPRPEELTMTIPFRVNSITPEPADLQRLDRFVDTFRKLPGARIIIRGFTDSSGTASYNRKLAAFRAEAVKTYLAGRGVDLHRVQSYGLTADNAPAGREVERQVELEILPAGGSAPPAAVDGRQ